MLSVKSTLVLLCAAAGVCLAGDCNKYSVGECRPKDSDVVGKETIPCEGADTHDCVRLCQRICAITTGCNYFSYNTHTEECTLVDQKSDSSYLLSCEVRAGPGSPTLDECSANTPEDSCDRFVAQDCSYLGKTVHSANNVADPAICQEFLLDFGAIYGGSLFVYDATPHKTCDLKDTEDRTCATINGPHEPDYDDCKSRIQFLK